MGNLPSELAKVFEQKSSTGDVSDQSDSDNDEKEPKSKQVLEHVMILPARAQYLSQSDLVKLVRSGTSHVVIDVRDAKMDHSGGHIAGSINISDKIFYESIPEILEKHGKSPSIIVYCMYSQRRSIKCVEFYAKAIQELIENYDKDTKQSHYFMYSLSKQSEEQHVDGQLGWMDDESAQKKVEIDFCDDEMIENLTKQKLYVVEGGFWMSINTIKDTEAIEGFDKTHYEQLELHGIFDKKMYYHKKEFFAKDQFMELKKAQKSYHFEKRRLKNVKKDKGKTDSLNIPGCYCI